MNLEESSYKRRNRFQIRNKDKNLIKGVHNVLDEQYKFYENLYKEDQNFELKLFEDFTRNLDGPKIRDNDKDMLEKEMTLQELKEVIFKSKTEKIPGSDGLNIEFYQRFFNEIKYLLLKVCNEVSENGLNTTARQGIITLIEKTGKNSEYLANWHPLSLLNCDGKIYMKMLSLRLELVSDYLISPDQSGFQKGRSIHDNLMDLLSLIDYADHKNIPVLIISFDFEKAFDKVNWKYMEQSLNFFGFGEKFIKMIMNAHVET